MSDRDEDRRRHEQNRDLIAENQRQIARLHGRLEATYENLPHDEGLIAEIVAETGADREMVVARLQVVAEQKLAALAETTAPPPDNNAPASDSVKRFREMIGS